MAFKPREDVLSWSEFDLHLLVACFLRARFPTVVALNKADAPEAAAPVARALAALGPTAVAVSARSELWLQQQRRRGHLAYVEGGAVVADQAPTEVREQVRLLRERVLEPYGSTGVMEVLSRAVLQRSPIFCCPVVDFDSLESPTLESSIKSLPTCRSL